MIFITKFFTGWSNICRWNIEPKSRLWACIIKLITAAISFMIQALGHHKGACHYDLAYNYWCILKTFWMYKQSSLFCHMLMMKTNCFMSLTPDGLYHREVSLSSCNLLMRFQIQSKRCLERHKILRRLQNLSWTSIFLHQNTPIVGRQHLPIRVVKVNIIKSFSIIIVRWLYSRNMDLIR